MRETLALEAQLGAGKDVGTEVNGCTSELEV